MTREAGPSGPASLAFGFALAAAAILLAGLLPVSRPGPAAAAEAFELTVPSTIDPTGATDVTDALNIFLGRVPNGATVGFQFDARYRVDGTLLVQNRRDITIEGNGATFFAPTDGSTVPAPRGGNRAGWPRNRQHWRIRGGGGITMRDLSIEGANPSGGATAAAYVPALEGQAGIAIQRVDGVVIDSVQVSDTFGDAVYVTGASVNVTIRNSRFERIGRQGVAIVNGQNVVVEGTEIRGVGRSVFDLEPGGRALVQGIHLQDNTIGDYRNFLLASGGGGPGVNDIWLERNRVTGGHGVSVYAGIEGRRRTDYHILDNSGSGAQQPPPDTGRPGLIQLQNLDRVEIRGNRQPVDDVPAISLDRVCALTTAGNQFRGASEQELVVAPCGATGPTPTTPTSPSRPTTPTGAGTSGAGSDGGGAGGDDGGSGDLLVAGLIGFAVAAGLGVAGFAWWRHRNRDYV